MVCLSVSVEHTPKRRNRSWASLGAGGRHVDPWIHASDWAHIGKNWRMRWIDFATAAAVRRFATITVASCYAKIVYVQCIKSTVTEARNRRCQGYDITDVCHKTTKKLKGWRSAAAVQAVCNGPSTSAAQSTTVHDALLHPHLRHCRQHQQSAGCHQLFIPRHRRSMIGRRAFSVAPARRPATRYQTTCEIRHLPLTVFAGTCTLFFTRFTSVHSALEALRLCAI